MTGKDTVAEILSARADANHEDIQLLRQDVNLGFDRLHQRLDAALRVCSVECVNKFAAKSDVHSVYKLCKSTLLAITILALMFLFTHENEAVAAFERVLELKLILP